MKKETYSNRRIKKVSNCIQVVPGNCASMGQVTQNALFLNANWDTSLPHQSQLFVDAWALHCLRLHITISKTQKVHIYQKTNLHCILKAPLRCRLHHYSPRHQPGSTFRIFTIYNPLYSAIYDEHMRQRNVRNMINYLNFCLRRDCFSRKLHKLVSSYRTRARDALSYPF